MRLDRSKYIDKSQVIDKLAFLRASYAIMGYPAEARRIAPSALFRKDTFEWILGDLSQVSRMFFGFLCYSKLGGMGNGLRNEPGNRFGVQQYGNALEHGPLAVTFVANSLFDKEVSPLSVEAQAEEMVNTVLSKWLDFEEFAKSQNHNKDFLGGCEIQTLVARLWRPISIDTIVAIRWIATL